MDPLNHMSTNNNSRANNRNICFTCTSSLIKAAQIILKHTINYYKYTVEISLGLVKSHIIDICCTDCTNSK
jgi:hypothetical protein